MLSHVLKGGMKSKLLSLKEAKLSLFYPRCTRRSSPKSIRLHNSKLTPPQREKTLQNDCGGLKLILSAAVWKSPNPPPSLS
ncbi:hypothetical protein EYF80_016271 [Liparis tanakae]|uniref:Uncharacterized protein n=1 Tax=Liparis tanakae TaxID=230148 RepID=A0A4Z2I6U6_9TELE|nr:hypothetical protein EYF80_016271 [Liparis tanakae]